MKHDSRLFLLSLIPLLCGGIFALAALYILFVGPEEYSVLAWEEIFLRVVPLYIAIVVLFSAGNLFYISTKGKEEYDFDRNLLYNGAGLLLAVILLVNRFIM